jgi:hypothetical protein
MEDPIIKAAKKIVYKEILYFCIIFFTIILIVFGFAGLTKAGYLKNYLGINFLNPENNTENTDYLPAHCPGRAPCLKPVIYLFPTKIQKIKVELKYKGEIIADYPSYNNKINGWDVTAFPDGKIIDNTDSKEYSYLFWEGNPEKNINYDLSKGFIVEGKSSKQFLQDTLSSLGLTPKEYNEFIVFWYPKMKDNKFNLIHFAGKEYTDSALLTITPKPDSLLRIFMVLKPLNEYINVKPQEIKNFQRKGFTVIEWGGTEIN